MHPYATSGCVAGLKNAFRIVRASSCSSSSSCSSLSLSLSVCRKPEMCDAWLLLTRHGPDGARAHTGYAYGSMARACNPEGRSNPTPRALLLQPPEERRNARRRSDALGSRTYAHAESAHEVTRPQVFNPSLICCCCAYAGRETQKPRIDPCHAQQHTDNNDCV